MLVADFVELLRILLPGEHRIMPIGHSLGGSFRQVIWAELRYGTVPSYAQNDYSEITNKKYNPGKRKKNR
jgi:hypothetical protein